jgi:hypothetical protein
MSYVYADNFRGFSKAIIHLESVNFCVGENSTGKTSILALINLLCSPYFWHNLQFNTTNHEFGGFGDIISSKITGQRIFSIGIIQRRKTKEQNGENWVGILIAFQEMEGLPSLAFAAQLQHNKLTCIKAEGESFKFLSVEPPVGFPEKKAEEVFDFLVRQNDANLADYKPVPQQIPLGLPFQHLISYIEMAIASDEERKAGRFFQWPLSLQQIIWLAPIRTRPRRTYDGYGVDFSPEGEHTPFELRKIFRSKEKAKAFLSALQQFGKSSGLFRKVSIHNLGREAASPFEVLVTLTSSPLRINSVGYGVSQALPVIVEMLERPKGSYFAIQQPEVHLHPKAQAALGDLLFRMAEIDQKRFLIETHSDFMIDRFRQNMRRMKSNKIRAQVLFFERCGEGNKLSLIPILSNGEYATEQPSTFRDFFLKEQMSILGI